MSSRRLVIAASATLALLAAAGLPLAADTALPPQLRDVGFDQRLGAAVPLDLVLRDERGAAVSFGDAMAGRPTVLALVYYECPLLCNLVLQGMVRSLRAVTLEPGRDFQVVAVSFDPRETAVQAAQERDAALAQYGKPGTAPGWRFLTGEEQAVRRLAGAVGFRYKWDDAAGQFAHAAGLVLLTPDGKVARYLLGADYAPRDLRLGLVETAGGTIGGISDQLLLLCYHYDPAAGRYSAAAINLVRAGGIATVAALAGFIFTMWRRERGGAAGGRSLRSAGRA